MVDIGSGYLETLKTLLNGIRVDFLIEGDGKEFLDFYYGWREQRHFKKSTFELGRKCHLCRRPLNGEEGQLIIPETITAKSTTSYYFHPSCFDALVIQFYVNPRMIDGGR